MKKTMYVLLFVALSGCRVTGDSAELCIRYCQDSGVKYIVPGSSTDGCFCLDGSRITTDAISEKYNTAR